MTREIFGPRHREFRSPASAPSHVRGDSYRSSVERSVLEECCHANRIILCALDFSEASQAALRAAARLARQFKASLHVVFAQDPLIASVQPQGGAASCPDLCDELRDFVADTPDLDLAREPMLHVLTGEPAEQIDTLAERESVDLIAMGIHGLTGARSAFLGSTTVRMLKRTTTDRVSRDLQRAGAGAGGARAGRLTGPTGGAK